MNIQEEIREVAVSKNVNFLIGSGCSVGAIDQMSSYWEKAWDRKTKKGTGGNSIDPSCCTKGEYCDDCKQKGNDLLIEDVKKVSKMILGHLSDKKSANMSFMQKKKDKIKSVSSSYTSFLREVINLMNRMNSRQNPRNINIFTTNYDLFIEHALDTLSQSETFVINDGARGYFKRVLDSSNFNRTVSYRGPSNNFVDEIPSISLIKPHGSVNWERTANEEIEIKPFVVRRHVVVSPDGHESRETFEENYFHDMLRVFQTELDKPQSVLFVIGFSFQDKHIAKMMRRALRNKELNVYIFCYSNDTEDTIRKNLECGTSDTKNLKFIRPQDFPVGKPWDPKESDLTLNIVTNILKSGVK